MPVSAKQYDVAKRALTAAMDEPDAYSEAEIRGLNKILADYQNEGIKIEKSTSEKPLGEGGSMFGGPSGPTGMDMLEKNITSPEQHAQVQKAREKSPQIYQALNLTSQLPKQVIPDETEEEHADRVLDYRKNTVDESMASASQRKDLYAPPEYHAPKPQTQPTNPIEAFTGAIGKARESLPAFVPAGKVAHYLEPPIQQFQRDMAPTLGPRVLQMSINDRDYKEYADQLWKKIYDDAQAKGESVVRTRYRTAKDWKEKVENVGAEVIGAGAAAARGVDEAAFGGIASEMAATLSGGGEEQLKNYKRLAESNEIAHSAGQVVGGAAQLGAGGLASKGITKALGGLSGYGGAALRGGLAAAGSGAATNASMAAAEDRLPTGEELGYGALLGLPFGLVGGLHGKNLRDNSMLGQVEKSGVGRTSMLKGVSGTSVADEISARALARMGDPNRGVDQLADELEKPLATAGRRLETGTRESIAQEQGAYFKLKEGERKPVSTVARDALEIRKSLVSPDGNAIPGAEDNLKFLDKFIASTTSAEIVPAAGGKPLVPAAVHGAISLTPEDAARMGIDVQQKMDAYMQRGNAAPGEGFMLRIKPRELNPRELELMTSKLDLALKQGLNPNREEMNQLLGSVRADRDAFGAGGPVRPGTTATVDTGTKQIQLKDFSAQQRLSSEKLGNVKRTLGMANLGENIPETLGADEAKAFQGGIRGYRQAGQAPGVDDALRELAALAGESQKLEQVAGMRGLKELNGGIPLSRASLLQGARLRLDPMLQFLGPAMGAAMPGAVQRQLPQQLPPQMSPQELEKQRGSMGFFPYGPPL